MRERVCVRARARGMGANTFEMSKLWVEKEGSYQYIGAFSTLSAFSQTYWMCFNITVFSANTLRLLWKTLLLVSYNHPVTICVSLCIIFLCAAYRFGNPASVRQRPPFSSLPSISNLWRWVTLCVEYCYLGRPLSVVSRCDFQYKGARDLLASSICRWGHSGSGQISRPTRGGVIRCCHHEAILRCPQWPEGGVSVSRALAVVYLSGVYLPGVYLSGVYLPVYTCLVYTCLVYTCLVWTEGC